MGCSSSTSRIRGERSGTGVPPRLGLGTDPARRARHHGGVLDHRVYRAAFLPALVALFVVAFSLADPARPRTTTLAPDAFQADRAFGPENPPPAGSLRALAATFPYRRAGSRGDNRLADAVARIIT